MFPRGIGKTPERKSLAAHDKASKSYFFKLLTSPALVNNGHMLFHPDGFYSVAFKKAKVKNL